MRDTRVKPLYATDKFISLCNKKPQATVLATFMYIKVRLTGQLVTAKSLRIEQ